MYIIHIQPNTYLFKGKVNCQYLIMFVPGMEYVCAIILPG